MPEQLRVPYGTHKSQPHQEPPPEGDLRLDVPGRSLSLAIRRALGPLLPYLGDGTVSDLFVNGDQGLWRNTGSGPVRQPEWAHTEAEVRALAVALVAAGGRHLDERNPCQDVRLAEGIRVHAVLPPVSVTGTLLSVRIPRSGLSSLRELVQGGLCDAATHEHLREAVRARRNLLITGGTGTGKTTLLAALLALADPQERIITVEDVAELRIHHPHRVSLETRQENLEGAGEIGLGRLVREALRMRPDRLVVGECRGAEIGALLHALNTGHDGGAGTVHASSLREVPARLEALGALAGLGEAQLARQAVHAIHLVVHLEVVAGRHRIAGLGRCALNAEKLLTVVPLSPPPGPARAGAQRA